MGGGREVVALGTSCCHLGTLHLLGNIVANKCEFQWENTRTPVEEQCLSIRQSARLLLLRLHTMLTEDCALPTELRSQVAFTFYFI